MIDYKNELIKSLPVVIKDGFDPIIIYTQAYHETGSFNSFAGNYNYFGMKCPLKVKPPIEGWDGMRIPVTTHENINGKDIKIIDYFCAFENSTKCLTFYIFQIKRLYKECYENRKSPQAYFYWLKKKGWATDPFYDVKLDKLYAHFNANGIMELINNNI
jgi:flagellum-specific peptidoglycan hydrolase FlgJ